MGRFSEIHKAQVGIPIKLFYEGVGHVITIEIRNGVRYRGTLVNLLFKCIEFR